MTYKGCLENGRLVLDEPVLLPEGALFQLEMLDQVQSEVPHLDIVRLAGILPTDIDACAEYCGIHPKEKRPPFQPSALLEPRTLREKENSQGLLFGELSTVRFAASCCADDPSVYPAKVLWDEWVLKGVDQECRCRGAYA